MRNNFRRMPTVHSRSKLFRGRRPATIQTAGGVRLLIGSRDTGKTAVDRRTLFTCQFPGWIPEIPRALNARRSSMCQFIPRELFFCFSFSRRSAPLIPLHSRRMYTHRTRPDHVAPNARLYFAPATGGVPVRCKHRHNRTACNVEFPPGLPRGPSKVPKNPAREGRKNSVCCNKRTPKQNTLLSLSMRGLTTMTRTSVVHSNAVWHDIHVGGCA